MAEPVAAWLYDGLTAERRNVTVTRDGPDLVLMESGDRVPFASLKPMGDRQTMVFGRAGMDGWRLGFVDPPPVALSAALPWQEHHGGLIDRVGLVAAVLIGLALATIVVVGLTQGTALVARLIPEKWELAFGDAMSGDLGGRVCAAPAGQRALDRLASRLAVPGSPVRVRVVDLGLVNAVTLPGRQVVIFRGLLGAARSPDEVAGVLGHELGHVDNRDVMTGLLRDFGISLLIGGADGGKIANALLSSRYGRAAERAADAHAIGALARADISPADTAAFFDRLGRREPDAVAGKLLTYLSTHPLSAERRRAFLTATRRAPPYRPAMSAEEWQALRAICARPGTAGPAQR